MSHQGFPRSVSEVELQARRLVEHFKGTVKHPLKVLAEDAYDVAGFVGYLTLGSDRPHVALATAVLSDAGEQAASYLSTLSGSIAAAPTLPPWLLSFLISTFKELIEKWLAGEE